MLKMLLKVSGNVKYIKIAKYTSHHLDVILYVFEIKTGSSTDVGKTVYKYSSLFSIVTFETIHSVSLEASYFLCWQPKT